MSNSWSPFGYSTCVGGSDHGVPCYNHESRGTNIGTLGIREIPSSIPCDTLDHPFTPGGAMRAASHLLPEYDQWTSPQLFLPIYQVEVDYINNMPDVYAETMEKKEIWGSPGLKRLRDSAEALFTHLASRVKLVKDEPAKTQKMRGAPISLGGNEIPAVPSTSPFLQSIIDSMESMDVRTKPNKEVWRDLEPGRRGCLYLEKLSFGEIVCLGEATFPQLTWHVTEQTVGRLMLLAYNTMDRYGMSVFDFVPVDLMNPALSIDVDELPNDPWSFAEVHHPVEYFGTIDDPSKDDWDNMENVARGMCYLACSYLRLFSMSSESYIGLGHHLEDGFARFYNSRFPLRGYRLSFEALRNMKMMMESIPYLKNTFYNILYAGETWKHGESLKDFLYGDHVRYTGLLSYRLFLKCMELMKLSSREMAKIIYTKKFDSELRAICGIFSKLQPSERNGTEFGMWKYACIFDQTFLRPLREKKSHLFTLSLAMLIKELVPSGEFDPLLMVEISNSTPCMLDMANYFAKRAVVIYAATRASPGYEEIVESKVMNDRRGTRRACSFGFGTLAPGQSIHYAIEGMNYRNIDARNITVNEAQSRGSSGYRGGGGGWYSGNRGGGLYGGGYRSGRFAGGGYHSDRLTGRDYWRRGGSGSDWRD